MSNKIKKHLLLTLAAAIGFSSIQLPKPYSYIGIALLLISFIVLIVIGYKVSFRVHDYGIFAWWINPGKLFSAELNEAEKRVLLFAIVLVASVFVAILIKTLYLI